MRPSDSEQDAPMNLEVPKKPWYNRAPTPPVRSLPEPGPVPVIHSPNYTVQDEPVDFSKKKECASQLVSAKREYQFQRNLIVILIQNFKRSPARGKDIVRFLKASCEKVQSRGCSGGKNGAPNQAAQGHQQGGGAGGGGGGFSGVPSGGGSTGGSLHSSRSNSTDQDDDMFDVGETDFDSIDFEFSESATRKWISENPDLSPLKVLDHINFKNDTQENPHAEVPKPPPDLATLDRDTATFLQLAVPVPDPSSTFLDIGTDFGPVSLYEDDPFNLEQLIPSTFNLGQVNSPQQPRLDQPLYPIHNHNNNIQPHSQPLHLSTNISHQHQVRPVQQQQKSPLELPAHLAFQTFLPETTTSPHQFTSTPLTHHIHIHTTRRHTNTAHALSHTHTTHSHTHSLSHPPHTHNTTRRHTHSTRTHTNTHHTLSHTLSHTDTHHTHTLTHATYALISLSHTHTHTTHTHTDARHALNPLTDTYRHHTHTHTHSHMHQMHTHKVNTHTHI